MGNPNSIQNSMLLNNLSYAMDSQNNLSGMVMPSLTMKNLYNLQLHNSNSTAGQSALQNSMNNTNYGNSYGGNVLTNLNSSNTINANDNIVPVSFSYLHQMI